MTRHVLQLGGGGSAAKLRAFKEYGGRFVVDSKIKDIMVGAAVWASGNDGNILRLRLASTNISFAVHETCNCGITFQFQL